MLGIVAPIIVALFIWGAGVERHNAAADLGRQVIVTELKRLETRIDALSAEIAKVKEQR
jgi:uncharacterized small protein (DUF1192 family)